MSTDEHCNAPGPVEDCPRHRHLAEREDSPSRKAVGRLGWSGNVPTFLPPPSLSERESERPT